MMWRLKLAWKNLWRNRSRTFITMAAVYFAVMLSIIAGSLKKGIFDNLVNNVVSFYTGYIQIHKAGYYNEQNLDNAFIKNDSLIKKIEKFKNVTRVTTRLESFVLASSEEKTKGCLLTGIIPKRENEVTHLKAKLVKGNYLNDNGKEILMSSGLAERLNVKIYDTIVLLGQGYHGTVAAGKYQVKGLLKFGSPELNGNTAFMGLNSAREFFNTLEMGTTYVVGINNPKQLQSTADGLRSLLGKEYELMTWEEIMPDVKQHIDTDSKNMNYIQGILYLLICFGILGTMIMMMTERNYEMGILIAIGMRKCVLTSILAFESIIMVTTGCILGILTGIPIVIYLKKYPLRITGETAKAYERFGFEPIFPASTDLSNFIQQGLVVLIIGILLSGYPLYKIIRLKPAIAIKR